jgi:hypothetical protein
VHFIKPWKFTIITPHSGHFTAFSGLLARFFLFVGLSPVSITGVASSLIFVDSHIHDTLKNTQAIDPQQHSASSHPQLLLISKHSSAVLFPFLSDCCGSSYLSPQLEQEAVLVPGSGVRIISSSHA